MSKSLSFNNKKMKSKINKFKKQGQYPRKTKNWLRYRREDPKKFIKSSFRTVPLNHTKYKGKIKGEKAVVGRLKKNKKWEIQSVLKRRK